MAGRAEDTTPIASTEFADQQLKRTMGLQHLIFMALAGIIGSGWLLATLGADSVAGPASVFSWLIGGVLVLLIALPYMEISGMLPRSGAIVRYPHLTHGAATGFVMGWAYLVYALTIPAIEAIAALQYLGGRFPTAHLTTINGGVAVLSWPSGVLLGLTLQLIFFSVNYFGIRLLSNFTLWITWWKLVIPTLTFILLFFAFKGSNFTQYGGLAPYGISPIFQAVATAGIVFAYTGFRQALEFAGEARNPQRDVPIATVVSILVTIALYIGLQIAFTGALDFHKAGIHPGAWSALTSSNWASSPLYSELTAAGIGLLGAFGTLLLIDAAISPTTTGLLYLGTGTRTFYGMSVDGYFPKSLQLMSRFGIPWPALVVSALIGAIFFYPLHGWYTLVAFCTSAAVITYMMGGLGLPVLRRTAPNMVRPFKLPAFRVFSPLGFVAAVMILYWAGFATIVNVYIIIFAGLCLFVWVYAPNKGWISPALGATMGVVFLACWVAVNIGGGWFINTTGKVGSGALSFPVYFILLLGLVLAFGLILWWRSPAEGRRHVASGLWVVGMLFAILLVSHYGEYGPLAKPPLGFPFSDLVVLAIGIVAYYWGQSSGFATSEIEELNRGGVTLEQAGPAVTPNRELPGQPA